LFDGGVKALKREEGCKSPATSITVIAGEKAKFSHWGNLRRRFFGRGISQETCHQTGLSHNIPGSGNMPVRFGFF